MQKIPKHDSVMCLQKQVHEARTEDDPQGMVTLEVYRKGTEGVVNVVWRLSSNSADDFLPPLTGTITFGQVGLYNIDFLKLFLNSNIH